MSIPTKTHSAIKCPWCQEDLSSFWLDGTISDLKDEVYMLREANAAAIAAEQRSRNEANRLRQILKELHTDL